MEKPNRSDIFRDQITQMEEHLWFVFIAIDDDWHFGAHFPFIVVIGRYVSNPDSTIPRFYRILASYNIQYLQRVSVIRGGVFLSSQAHRVCERNTTRTPTLTGKDRSIFSPRGFPKPMVTSRRFLNFLSTCIDTFLLSYSHLRSSLLPQNRVHFSPRLLYPLLSKSDIAIFFCSF